MQNNLVVMNALLSACLFIPVLEAAAPTGNDILSILAATAAARRVATYSGWREYSIRNLRFGKSASVKVRMTSRAGGGKQFTVVARSGSPRLISVIETLLAHEAEASNPGKARAHEIGPSNYQASMVRSEVVAGRDCWVLALTPKAKDKYLLKGTAWVDKATHALVRLDGTTAASVSIWVGTPHVVEDFAPVGGMWLPVHTVSSSASMLLGETDLDIRYMGYDVISNRLSDRRPADRRGSTYRRSERHRSELRTSPEPANRRRARAFSTYATTVERFRRRDAVDARR